MISSIINFLLWTYWRLNKWFIIAFSEALLGYGEGDSKVDGSKIYAQVTDFLKNHATPAVFVQFVGTLILLPLYVPRRLPRSALLRGLVELLYAFKSFFLRWLFLLRGKRGRTKVIDEMFRRLIRDAPEQENDLLKTIVTLTVFKWVLTMAHFDQDRIWEALDYKPVHKRAWDPPTGPDVQDPPRAPELEMLKRSAKTASEVAAKPPGQTTYCVIGSGAGGAVAAHTIKERDPDARVIMLEAGTLWANDQFSPRGLWSVGELYMNAAVTLSKDMQFVFQQGRAVGGSTVVYNSVSYTPEGFWWDDMVQRWGDWGVQLDWENLREQYRYLDGALSVDPVKDRVIIEGSTGIKNEWERQILDGQIGQDNTVVTAPAALEDCIGCGRCNFACQFNAKRSMLVTLIPEFVEMGGLLVPETKATELIFEGGRNGKRRVQAVKVETSSGEECTIEADRVVLAPGFYASSKLLWRSGFTGARPGVRTVGKQISVNAGTPIIGVFPERLDGFDGQQIGFALEVPSERMIIETAFVPPAVVAMTVPMWGAEFQRLFGRINNMAAAVPVFATDAFGEIKRGIMGESGFVLDFALNHQDWRRLGRGMRLMAETLFGMGAEEVFINRFSATTLKRGGDIDEYFAAIGPSDFITTQSAHLQGGNVINPNECLGVVDENMKIHGIENAWICDASVMPSPITLNIALTVSALSRYAALRIVEDAA